MKAGPIERNLSPEKVPERNSESASDFEGLDEDSVEDFSADLDFDFDDDDLPAGAAPNDGAAMIVTISARARGRRFTDSSGQCERSPTNRGILP